MSVLQGALTVCESTVVKLIGHDGNINERKLGESSVHLKGVRRFQLILLIVTGIPFTVCLSCLFFCQTAELVVSPVTEEAQKAFSDLTTVGLLQQELQ